jgi:hypothetical protein
MRRAIVYVLLFAIALVAWACADPGQDGTGSGPGVSAGDGW